MNNKLTDKDNRILLFLWSVICAFLVLLYTSRSSVLFVCNNWDDANSYFTMGKGLMNGLVLYRDMYDQKGPFLYLLYGLAYLISEKTFFGVFIFEIIAGAFTLFFAALTIKRRSSERIAIIALPVLAAGMYSSWSFYWGGAAEELCLPFLAYALYALDGMMTDSYEDDKWQPLFMKAGICAGIVAQVKYTMLGFFAAWFVVALMMYAGKRKSALEVVTAGIRFIAFALVPSIPWLIYFIATSSLDDWYRCYIYNNLFFYSQVGDEDYTLIGKMYEMTKTLYWLVRDSASYFVFVIAGFVLQLFMEKKILKKFIYVFMFACTYFVIFIGGNKLAYYSIPLMVFAISGAAYLGQLISGAAGRITNKRKGIVHSHKPVIIYAVLAVASLVLGTVFASQNTMNAWYRGQTKEDVWLVKAAEYLGEDDTLLSLNAIDAGLFTVTGIVPSCEYFQTNGINLPTMFEEQKKYLKDGITDYVVAASYEPEFIDEKYELIRTFSYDEPGHEEKYYLYKKKEQTF